MKVQSLLIVQTPAFNPNNGGVQRITYNLGKYFYEQGIAVRYFSFEHDGHVEPEYGYLHYSRERGGCDNMSNIVTLDEILRRNRFDVVINQMPYENQLRRLLRQQREEHGYSLLGCIHNSLFNFKSNVRDVTLRALPYPMNKLMATAPGLKIMNFYHKVKHAKSLRNILDGHDLVLLYTPPNHEELRYFVGDYQNEKIRYMPNPLADTPELNRRKEKLILHVGRINVPQKRSDLLLDFWEAAYKEMGDWKFVIVGEGPYFDSLKNDLKKRRLPRIEIAGHQKPEPYYERASIFMMPSAFEGFPNTVIEAQGYGCPVLAFDSYMAIRWIVRDGKDAVLVKPFDVKAMAQEAINLAQNEDRRHGMQRKAKDNADRFAIHRVGKKWIHLFKQLEEK